MADDDPILELQNVSSGYGEIQVLKNVSLRVPRQKLISIIGANGAGKSTLLKTIFQIVKPTNGRVIYQGEEISRLSPIQVLKRGLSYVPEGRMNFPNMTVQENLEMGAFTRADQKQIAATIEDLCRRFPVLQEKRQAAVGNLSGGQQQMVEIAIALMLQPRIMLIDEPTMGLAPILVDQVFQAIQEIHASGTTIVLVEQNAKRALEISDYAFVLELGAIRYEGRAEDLMQNEEVDRAYLGER